MSDAFTVLLREADEQFARASENCATGCSAPVAVVEPEPLCAECAREMHQ